MADAATPPTVTTAATTEATGVAAAATFVPPVATSPDPLAGLNDDTILGGPAGIAPQGDTGTAEGEAGGAEPPEAAAPAAAPETYDLKAPEGKVFDTEAFKLAEPVLRELKLSNEQAQKLVDVYPAIIARAGEQAQSNILSQVVAQRKAWADAAAGDAEIGGAKLDESTALAAKAMDVLAIPQAFREFLFETGLGNHPEMIRAMVKVGRAVSEDGFARGDGGARAKSDPELFYGQKAPA